MVDKHSIQVGGGGGGRRNTPSHSMLGILSWSSIPSRGRVEIPPSHSMLQTCVSCGGHSIPSRQRWGGGGGRGSSNTPSHSMLSIF